MKIAGKKTKSRGNGNFTLNKNVIIAVIAVLVVVALIVALIVLLPSKKDEGDKSTTTKAEAPITGISVDESSKKEYYVGDEFDRANTFIKLEKKDGTSKLIDGNDPNLSFSKLDTTILFNSQTITVTYKDGNSVFTTTFEVSVANTMVEVVGTVTGIKIVSKPTRSYGIGEELDTSKITIAVTVAERTEPYYINASYPDVVVSGFDSSAVNPNVTITVTYADFSESYSVEIVDKSNMEVHIMSLHIVNYPKLTYYVGDEFSKTGTRVQVVTNSLSTNYFVYADDEKLTFSGFDSSKPAENQVITITYEGVSTTFTVNIKAYGEPEPELQSIEIVDLIDTYSVEEWNEYGINLFGAYVKETYEGDPTPKGSYPETRLNWEHLPTNLPKVNAPGDIELVITYKGITKTVTIHIVTETE